MVKYVVCLAKPSNGGYFDTININRLIWLNPLEPFLFLIWLSLERWTLAYKSEVKGHSDLILWLPRDIDQRYLHAWLEDCGCHSDEMCHTSKLAKSSFKCLLWPWKWGQGQMCDMIRKASPWAILWHNKTGLSVETLCNTATFVPHLVNIGGVNFGL